MHRFRTTLFWLHLAAGLFCGLIIAIMSFTGAVLAFEGEIVAWAERDVRRVDVPAATPGSAEPQLGSGSALTTLPLDELLAKARAAAPAGAKLTGLTVSRDPRDAVSVNFGREAGVYYVNPYTGAVLRPATTRTANLMRTLVEWHRYLGQSGEKRPLGKAVTGVCNLAFLFLALSGLWLWWPRAWTARVLRPSLWFVRSASGRARDWNWHNVIGFWSLPTLVVLTASGAVIGYAWANDLVYRAIGEKPQRSGAAQAAPAEIVVPPAGTPRLDFASVLARVQGAYPDWRQITVREGYARRPEKPPAIEPFSATLQPGGGIPAFALTQVVLHPHTGEILSSAGYPDQTPGRQVRTWLRYLHTGQALGWPGQLIAGLASLGGCLLVYTGFALAWRRFFGRRAPAAALT